MSETSKVKVTKIEEEYYDSSNESIENEDGIVGIVGGDDVDDEYVVPNEDNEESISNRSLSGEFDVPVMGKEILKNFLYAISEDKFKTEVNPYLLILVRIADTAVIELLQNLYETCHILNNPYDAYDDCFPLVINSLLEAEDSTQANVDNIRSKLDSDRFIKTLNAFKFTKISDLEMIIKHIDDTKTIFIPE